MSFEDKKYCAFLRGVNVNGTNMKMADVCSVFESVGVKNVSAVLATGNIVFSSEIEKFVLKNSLEQAMSAHFDYEAFLFLKDKNEIEIIFNNTPFVPKDDFHIYCFVGIDEVENILMTEFENGQKTEGEEAKIMAQNFYWKVAKGNTLDAAFGKILGRKYMKGAFTSRNINTLEKVLKKM